MTLFDPEFTVERSKRRVSRGWLAVAIIGILMLAVSSTFVAIGRFDPRAAEAIPAWIHSLLGNGTIFVLGALVAVIGITEVYFAARRK